MSEPLAITSGDLTARIDPMGAELLSLTDAAGREYMTDADPRWWTGHAPILFPIVGALNGGRYRLGGEEYALEKHGFARKSLFRCEEHEPYEWARFVLEDSAATRGAYPFAFRLDLFFRVWGATLTTTATVSNRGDSPMPFSFGFHPAFAWPLPGGAHDAHRIYFAEDEPQPIRRIDPASGLLLPEPFPTPVAEGRLAPDSAMFEPDALIWDRLHSRSCEFGAPGGGSVSLEWENLPMLGIWQKPGAPYLCIEPWQGIADPVGFTGELTEKPGIVSLPPGQDMQFTLAITVTPPKDRA
ncbi:aldose 1-epimerase family protein [Qipengyuania sp.]|uniref:aldose 1-epimerase family protein n=1 Tax=Qipengyuania sp. TaxID=2004515 RepID=UPI0035C87682